MWWFTLVQAGQTPVSLEDFKTAITIEFVPDDPTCRAHDGLRRVKQSGSVSKYLSEFRNTTTVTLQTNKNDRAECNGIPCH